MKFWSALAALYLIAVSASAAPVPHLADTHGTTQLMVDGKPFLVLGAELENSSASSPAFMQKIWPRLAALHVNTVLAPVSWELIEPQEGRFDFSSVDDLLQQARAHQMRLVLLYFGSWKNSMSSYVPAWVKRDSDRFPRVKTADGKAQDILSPFSPANLTADRKAFVALMRYLKAKDPQHTVIMVQSENEVGMIPEARDHSGAAEAAFAAPVPFELTDYLTKNEAALAPSMRAAWQEQGKKSAANWEETFGPGPATDEIFNAWYQARYTGAVAAAGKAVLPLPMFANAALIRPGKQPGQYPSGGPLPQVFDVWRAAAPALDMLSPDLYFPNFGEWAERYAVTGNPLFIPETGRVSGAEMAANAFLAFGKMNAIGVSPYAPEFLSDADTKDLADGYDVLSQLAPKILAAQGTGRLFGFRPPIAFDGTADLTAQEVLKDGYRITVRFKRPAPISIGAKEEVELPGSHGGLMLQTGPDEFLLAGTGMIVTVASTDAASQAGLELVEEGRFVKGVWVPGRRLNGDETNQGRQVELPMGRFGLIRVRLFHYH